MNQYTSTTKSPSEYYNVAYKLRLQFINNFVENSRLYHKHLYNRGYCVKTNVCDTIIPFLDSLL